MSSTSSAERPGPRAGFLRAGAWLAVVGLIYALAVWTPYGQRLDSHLMGAGLAPLTPVLPAQAFDFLRLGSVYLLAAMVACLGVRGLWQRKWGTVARCAILVTCAVGSASWLRRTLKRPELGDPTYPFNTLPSGHAASSAALIAVALILAPAKLPPWARAAALLCLLTVSGASVATFAHRPSDVVASLALVTALIGAFFPTPSPAASDRTRWRRRAGLGWLTAAVALAFTMVPGLSEFAIVANAAWLLVVAVPCIDAAVRARPKSVDA